jgi:hypothetical protein
MSKSLISKGVNFANCDTDNQNARLDKQTISGLDFYNKYDKLVNLAVVFLTTIVIAFISLESVFANTISKKIVLKNGQWIVLTALTENETDFKKKMK